METKIIITQFLITSHLFISNLQNSLAASPPPSSTKPSKTVYKNYLRTACNSTTFPKLCYSSLSPYTSTIKTNDLKLCKTALIVTTKAAKKTYSLIKKISKQKGLSKADVAVVKDCMEEIGDAIDELKQSVKTLGSINGTSADTQYEIDSIKTWISAVITDDTTCTDEFDDMKVSSSVKIKIMKSVQNLTSLTSNSLALLNILAY